MFLAAFAALLVAGCLIGLSGIGGILVVPALRYLLGMPLDAAIAATSCAFMLTGVIAIWQVRRRGASIVRSEAVLLAASVPGALAGATAVGWVADATLLLGIAALSMASGLWGLMSLAHAPDDAPMRPGQASTIGLLVGFGSALTGTGGAVLLAPALVFLRQPVERVVRLGQLIQLPIALCATAAHLRQGHLDLLTAAVVGLALVAGMLVGNRLADRVATSSIRRTMCGLLVVVGAGLAARAVL